jgi:hypothetical protein
MITLPQVFMAASALVVFMLGSVHLLYTFRGEKLRPRDAALEAQMKSVSPILTRQTTMWRAWIGFNASHSLGAIFFGLIYGYLALAQSQVLFHSHFLMLVGLALLLGYVALARAYWFSIPFRGILLSLGLYLGAFVANWL